MKKLLIALAAVLVTAASYAQGTVNFSTRVTGAIDAPVTVGTTGVGPGATFSAALYLVSGGTETLIPTSVTTFRSGAGAAYIVGVNAEVPGVPGGGTANLRMRAWQTAAGSFEAAKNSTTFAWGESTPFNVVLTAPPATPADIPAGAFTGFQVNVIPEPSTIALGVLGAAALLLRRRK